MVKTTIEKVLNVIEHNYSNKDFKGPEIAKTIGMSLSTLQRKVKEESDYTLGELFYGFRINKAKQMLGFSPKHSWRDYVVSQKPD